MASQMFCSSTSSQAMHFKFKKQVMFQKVSLTKFQNVELGKKCLISESSKLVFKYYYTISHDPLDQSNSLSWENKNPHVSRKLKRNSGT